MEVRWVEIRPAEDLDLWDPAMLALGVPATSFSTGAGAAAAAMAAAAAVAFGFDCFGPGWMSERALAYTAVALTFSLLRELPGVLLQRQPVVNTTTPHRAVPHQLWGNVWFGWMG